MIRGDRIHDLRAAHGMTMETLGKKIGVSKATIKRYENGIIQNVPSDKIEAIAEALETTPEYLMGWEAQENKDDITDQDLAAFAQEFSRLPEEKQKQVLDYMRFLLSKHE